MRQFLKILLILLGVLLLAGIIMGLAGPKTYQVERSAVVAASPNIVWPYVSSIKKTEEWSPWNKMDTTMVIEYTGTDGEVGSGSKWESRKMFKGEQLITALEAPRSVDTKLKFHMPWGSSESNGYFRLEPEAAGTKVTWGMKGENNFLGRIMGSMMSMEKSVGSSFESGLADLQKLIDDRTAAVPAGANYKITTTDYPGATFLGVRGDVMMKDMASFYENSLGAVMTALKGKESDIAGMPTGLYYSWDMEKGMTNMVAAIPVKEGVLAGKGMEIINVPPSKALIIDYLGGYHGIGGAHMALEDHINANKLEVAPPVMEAYLTDPGMEPDSNKWLTRIVYPLK